MAIDILHKILAFEPCQFDRLLVFSVLTARLSTGSPSFSFSFPHKLAKKRRLSENALSLRTSAHAPLRHCEPARTLVWQSSLGQPGQSVQGEKSLPVWGGVARRSRDRVRRRRRKFVMLSKDAPAPLHHPSRPLGVTPSSSRRRTSATALLRHCEPVHRLLIFTSSFLHSFIPKIPSRFVGCS